MIDLFFNIFFGNLIEQVLDEESKGTGFEQFEQSLLAEVTFDGFQVITELLMPSHPELKSFLFKKLVNKVSVFLQFLIIIIFLNFTCHFFEYLNGVYFL